jgi:uncharacterized DUF497 family protein
MENAPDFADFQWDADVGKHVGRHGLRVAIIHAVVKGTPRVFENTETGVGSHRVIGPDRRGRFWTIIFVQARSGRWRPVTGWPSTAREIRRYKEDEDEG